MQHLARCREQQIIQHIEFCGCQRPERQQYKDKSDNIEQQRKALLFLYEKADSQRNGLQTDRKCKQCTGMDFFCRTIRQQLDKQQNDKQQMRDTQQTVFQRHITTSSPPMRAATS